MSRGIRTWLAAAAIALAAPLVAETAKPVYTTAEGVAIRGYDPVAYFTDGKATPGLAEHAHEWNGARWIFASAAHRDLFAAQPEKYAPRFGGYCAWAAANDYVYEADPAVWYVHEGKLYLNYDRKAQEAWSADRPGNIRRAEANWPHLVAQP